ncbi:MAG: hypothetical protein QE271_09010 [Bacteriovoracaceae bacterium]|nr:hypothetical protein [Bacteriovoracaceae bacterium]
MRSFFFILYLALASFNSTQASSKGVAKEIEQHKPSYVIDVIEQKITFFYVSDLAQEQSYEIKYESVKKLFPNGIAPDRLDADMIFNTNFILRVFGLIRGFGLQDFIQGDLFAQLEQEEEDLYIVSYKLQYFQRRSGYYSTNDDAAFKQEYTNYFGDHELGKPTIIKVYLGKAKDLSISNLQYDESSNFDSKIDYDMNGKKQTFFVNDFPSLLENQWRIDFTKSNSSLIKFDDQDPLFKWKLYYGLFNGYRVGSKLLQCNNAKCFKQVYEQTYSKNIKKLKDQIKFSENPKKFNFEKTYVPLFLKVSLEESSFYKKISSYSYVTISFKPGESLECLGNGAEKFISITNF